MAEKLRFRDTDRPVGMHGGFPGLKPNLSQ